MTIQDIKRANADAGHHFFDRDTMRFFRSRIGSTVYQGNGGIFFVTSEQNRDEFPRLYTVREFVKYGRHIRTAGKFQQFKTSKEANTAAKKYATDGTPLDGEPGK